MEEVDGRHAAIETLFRALGGGQPTVYSAEAEQAEVDRGVIATMLWNLNDALTLLPERVAQQIWIKSPFNQNK